MANTIKPNPNEKGLSTETQRSLTPQERSFNDIKATFKLRGNEIAALAGDNINALWLINQALATIRESDKLTQASPKSAYLAVAQAARLGLEIGDNGGYLVPYKGQIQFQLGYRGLIDLCVRAGFCVAVKPVVVHEKDIFEVFEGTRQEIVHTVDYKQGATLRGPPVCVYAVAILSGGERDFEVLDYDTIERRRKSSKQADSGPWKDHYWAMARKTAVRALTNRMAKSARPKDRQLAQVVQEQLRKEDTFEFEGKLEEEDQDPEAPPQSATDTLAGKVAAARAKSEEWEEAEREAADRALEGNR